jgi:CRP-like cAMP-binding protein
MKYLREVSEHTYLFKQGETAQSMFVLIRGLIELRSQQGSHVQICGLVDSGQILGEKSVLMKTPYRRAFSAFARTSLAVLELKPSDMAEIREESPEIFSDMLTQMFLTAARRLDRSNALVHVLRSSDNVERVVRLILFFAQYNGRKVEGGIQVFLPESMVQYYIDVRSTYLEEIFGELQGKNLIVREDEEVFVVPDLKALKEHSGRLSSQFTSRQFDELESIP